MKKIVLFVLSLLILGGCKKEEKVEIIKEENKEETIVEKVEEEEKNYEEQLLDSWVDENIQETMSQEEKVKKIMEYCSSFPYNYNYNNYKDMLIYGSGECWANTDLLIQLCNLVGIEASVRTRSNTLAYPDFHINAYVVINGISYVVDVGHQDRTLIDFYPSKGYSYMIKEDGTIRITDYDSYAKHLIIPNTIDGYVVSEIGSKAFIYHFEMESLRIPGSVLLIDQGAFSQCTALKTIYISSAAKDISEDAFECSKTIFLGNTELWIEEGIENKTIITY